MRVAVVEAAEVLSRSIPWPVMYIDYYARGTVLAGELGDITSELEELADRLTALAELYKDDAALDSPVAHLIAARDKALRAAELSRQGSNGRSVDILIN